MSNLPNDRQYLSDGSEVVVLSRFDGGVVVQCIVECEDGPEQLERPRIVTQVFDSPPTKKVSEAVDRLTSEQKELTAKCRGLRDELKALEAEKASFLASHRHVTQVQRLVDFLEGHITHFAQLDFHQVSIFGWDGFKCEDDPRKLKLVTLLGDTRGDLQWKLNRYADGSSRSEVTIIPCTSHDEAIQAAQGFVDDMVATSRKNPNYSLSTSFFESAAKFGLSVPQDIIDAREAASRVRALRSIDELKAQIVRLEASL